MNCINLGLHARRIKNRKLIISNRDIPFNEIVITDNTKAYGTVKLHTKSKMDDTQFKKYEPYHSMNTVERMQRFGVDDLYAYTFTLTAFEPRKITLLSPLDTVLDLFAYDVNIKTFNPKHASDEALLNSHTLSHIWYLKKKRGFKHSMEDIINLHKTIVTEMHLRGLWHNHGDLSDEAYDNLFKPVEPSITKLVEVKSLNGKVVIAKREQGISCRIYKGATVKIYANKDVTKQFPNLVESIAKSSNYDYIAEGVIRDTCYLHDVLYFGKDISKEPWHVRRTAQNKIKTFNNLKQVQTYVTDIPNERNDLINFVSKLNNSDGAMIKDYNSNKWCNA